MEKPSFAITSIASLTVGLLFGYILFHSKAPKDTDAMDHSAMSMEDSMASMSHNLSGLSGPAFDQAFLKEMIIHHKGAVDMAEQVLEKSTRPELRKLAEDIIAAQTQEINLMENWERNWSGTSMNH